MDTGNKVKAGFSTSFSPPPSPRPVSTSCLYLAAKPIVGGPDWCAVGHGDNGWISECDKNCKDYKPKEV